ncbi:hypothetical protein ACSFA3_13860 [Variovorax sp. RHLX14]|uniref:hypothetical protein n=1 Tax=Variovorax sp. RHLX14 TaxID=1259731 RepID=UPI003F45F9F4
MTIPISTSSVSRVHDLTTRRTETAQTTALQRPPAGFTRTQSSEKTEPAARLGMKPHPIAVPMTGKRTLSDAQLNGMGAEILQLYKDKIIASGGRRLAFNGEPKWSIRGADIENLVIHTSEGLIQLRPDGSPTRNVALPIESWSGLENGLKSVLALLQELEKPKTRPAGAMPL